MQTSVDLSQLVSAIGDAVVVCDPDGMITLWNGAAERIFGFTEQEALGKSLDLIIPQRLQERHWSGYRNTMQTGQTRYGSQVLKVPAVRKGGGALSIAFTVALLRDAAGAVNGIASVIRDETERFQEERDLRKRLAALEARASA
ncbi:PAS domain-containing protein [Trinickia sp. Y13]|uniref:PAS domain-containing protein n=1 Tax=Trinickia sp. Y13 TaxID=2917807 RepID=UPI0024064C7A|nr:PAS domain-containing protein [Trinickia sp. Y13]MDG0024060.1 PAS domain-containing protein [Trinickia sp. Y13]